MPAALSASGWPNYSLFLRPDGLLAGCLETDDFAGGAADSAMVPLTEVFHLHAAAAADVAGPGRTSGLRPRR